MSDPTHDQTANPADAPDDGADAADPAAAGAAQLKAIVEALVFASPEPLTPKMLFKLLADEPKEDVAGRARRR